MNKIITIKDLPSLTHKTNSKSKKIILVGGCFDVLHPSHIEFLTKAKQLGDLLVVLLESDKTVKKLKGKNRPVFSQKERAFMLASLATTDIIILLPPFERDLEYFDLVKLIKPAIIAITDSDPLKSVKEKQAEAVGGKVVAVMKRYKDHSSSHSIKALLKEI